MTNLKETSPRISTEDGVVVWGTVVALNTDWCCQFVQGQWTRTSRV